jgi:hypothetical protein
MRHLLHCLYTDQLHPNFFTPPSPPAKELDLVALLVAADRYLVDEAQMMVWDELLQHFDEYEDANVLPVFDLARQIDPYMATRACQLFIEARAWGLLGNQHDGMEAQCLGLSDAAAARVVDMDLEGIDEIDLFRAIRRRYEHHLAEAKDDDGDDKGKDNSDDKTKKGAIKREAAIAEAKNMVAGLIKGIKTILIDADELSKVVEPSGLFTDAQLTAAYREAALTHRHVIKNLSGAAFQYVGDLLAHGKIRWSLIVKCRQAQIHCHPP